MLFPTIVLLLILLALSSSAVLIRYRNRRLLTSSGGLHLQILIFIPIGGIALLDAPNIESRLMANDIAEFAFSSCLPLLLGYAIVCALEYRMRRTKNKELPSFAQKEVSLLLLIGIGGILTASTLWTDAETRSSTAVVLATYMSLLYFPSILLSILQTKGGTRAARLVSIAALLCAVTIGFLSPWRSILIILACTVLLGVSVVRPRWLLRSCVVAMLVLLVVIPFQLVKRESFAAFQDEPMRIVLQSIEIEPVERLIMIEEFAAKRLSYVRELVYVKAALETNFQLKEGETYLLMVLNLVPRFLWSEKPSLADWAGYELPRELGIVDYDGGATSWAFNMFAEATYNFGTWSLVWFVPVIFAIAELLELLLRQLFVRDKAVAVGSLASFYLFLSATTLIFMVSNLVALLVIIKIFDLWFSRPQETATRPHFGMPRLDQ